MERRIAVCASCPQACIVPAVCERYSTCVLFLDRQRVHVRPQEDRLPRLAAAQHRLDAGDPDPRSGSHRSRAPAAAGRRSRSCALPPARVRDACGNRAGWRSVPAPTPRSRPAALSLLPFRSSPLSSANTTIARSYHAGSAGQPAPLPPKASTKGRRRWPLRYTVARLLRSAHHARVNETMQTRTRKEPNNGGPARRGGG